MKLRAVSVSLCAALAVGGALTALRARAETVVVHDKVMIEPSSLARPHRGMRMQEVEREFGQPTRRHPTVGKPPITRWDYAKFSVFFEYNRVIHTVVLGDRPVRS